MDSSSLVCEMSSSCVLLILLWLIFSNELLSSSKSFSSLFDESISEIADDFVDEIERVSFFKRKISYIYMILILHLIFDIFYLYLLIKYI